MPITASHLERVVQGLTPDQCAEIRHHTTGFAEPNNEGVAQRMYMGIRPVRRCGTLYLVHRESATGKYRLSTDGKQVKAALEARA